MVTTTTVPTESEPRLAGTEQVKHTPGPWTWRHAAGAGLQISAALPAGFQFDGTARGADGETSFMTWTVRQSHWVEIADERWVQFSTGSWDEMQRANACLIAAAPELLAELRGCAQMLATLASFQPDKEIKKEMREQRDAARAAIAKAEGRTP